MRELIDWLMNIERISWQVYRKASDIFDDSDLNQILQRSADDEAFHYQTMAAAHTVIKKHPEIKSAFTIDDEIKAPIENAFQQTLAQINDATLTREGMIDCMVTTEYSEWNDVFLYVVKTLKHIHPEFKSAAAEIQHHLKHIEHFLSSDQYGRQKVKTIQKLKPTWTERILIIEDSPIITEMLKAVLSREGEVDAAENGEAGLKKIQQNYYRLIISDIDMPFMDGITLYKKAFKAFPSIKKRYLFFTGNPDEAAISFLKAHKINFLIKPASVQELRKYAMASIHEIRDNPRES